MDRRPPAPPGPAAPGSAAAPGHPTPITLRRHRPGDIGWIVMRHAAVYHAEQGWDTRFEALVAHIGAEFLDRYDAVREACWIAERDGRPLGCVVLVQARDDAGQPEPGTAQLRLLLVEPEARGEGLGKWLVDTCESFAREAGYVRVKLWTNQVLHAARAIYQRRGYVLVSSETHRDFGDEQVGEVWELTL